VTFFTPRETSRLRFIEKTIGRKLEEIGVPSAAQVLDRQAESALAAAVARHAAGQLAHYAHALTAAADIAGLSRDDLAAALLATIVGDDGSLPVEIAPSRSRDHAARPESRKHDRSGAWSDRASHDSSGASHSRPDSRDRDARGSRDDADRRPRRYTDTRSDRPTRVDSERPWAARAARTERDERRPWDGPQRDRSADVARTDRPRKTKPRWDAERRAERNSGLDSRGASRTDKHAGAWVRDAAPRAAGRPERQGPSRHRPVAQRRSERSSAY
jgi:hypothetical protein